MVVALCKYLGGWESFPVFLRWRLLASMLLFNPQCTDLAILN